MAVGRRLDAFIRDVSLAESRREAKRLVKSGRVRVNGKPVRRPWWLVFPGDEIEVDGVTVRVGDNGGER
ncbi:S4 domain-containing protein [Methanopyrus sp. KOL6]|uniref:S4 domain-containing protein n=1 Tax=Methanopyrus sp. KOL6 TaxID=1937004 RepID=UPI0012F9BFCE|nr:S4 domain-containing protein [Methanopyrus sp. KOL6]